MKLFQLLLIGITALVIGGCVSESNDSIQAEEAPDMLQRHLELGIGYLRQGDYPRAKDKLNRALKLNGKSADVHVTFGLLFQLEGEPKLAEEYFKRAVHFDPGSAKARNSYGAFLFTEKRYLEAVDQLKIASENRYYDNRASVFQNLGVAYIRLNNIDEAEAAFVRAIQLNPSQNRAMIELADIKFTRRNYVEARELYDRYSRNSPATAKTLWLCVRLSRIFSDANEEASCAQALEGIFPASDEYREFKETL